jgi:hypothetical protein
MREKRQPLQQKLLGKLVSSLNKIRDKGKIVSAW